MANPPQPIGAAHASDAAWEGLWGDGSNVFADGPPAAADLPPEAGPFRFDPHPLLRKQ